ncbi:MAG: hypothetical protein HYX84_08640 [Chloroflexi bacterium]|nr:hypothetical protein [Chloroflexota bacterium]
MRSQKIAGVGVYDVPEVDLAPAQLHVGLIGNSGIPDYWLEVLCLPDSLFGEPLHPVPIVAFAQV